MKLVELYARVRYAVRIEALSRREAARRYCIVRLGLPRFGGHPEAFAGGIPNAQKSSALFT